MGMKERPEEGKEKSQTFQKEKKNMIMIIYAVEGGIVEDSFPEHCN